MQRTVIRRLTLLGILTALPGVLLLVLVNVVGIHRFATFGAIGGGVLLGISALALATADIGAIVRMGHLHQWRWFVGLLGLLVFLWPFGIVALLVYCVIGPEGAAPDPTSRRQNAPGPATSSFEEHLPSRDQTNQDV